MPHRTERRPFAPIGLLGRSAWIEWTVLFAAAVGLSWALAATRIVDPVDALVHDSIVRATPHAPDPRILIVAIDDASIRDLGRWPWARGLHARLIDQLSTHNVAVIGYDVLFVEVGPGDPALSAAVARAGNVAMPLLIEAPGENGAAFTVRQPVPPAAYAGHVMVRADPDGILRRAVLRDPVASVGKPHLSLEIARAAVRGAGLRDMTTGLIPFAGPPGTYATVSFVSVLRGEIPPELLRNRIVLVGATAPGLGDRFATPIGGDHDLMAGVEIQANIVDAVLNHHMRYDASTSLARVGLAIAVLLPLWLAFLIFSPRTNLVVAGVLIATLFGGVAALLVFGGIWIGPGAALVAVTVMFPLWGWRRLAFASQFLDYEIARLGREEDVAGAGSDRLGRQIALLDAAGRRIDMLRRQRDDTLAFLSHDLRSPAAAILASQPADERIAGHARRLLRLADQFVQGLRAEEAPLVIEPVETAAMLEEVADHCWEAAGRAGGRIEVAADADLPTIETDRALMARALVNLVENSLKYGGKAPLVHLRAWSSGGHVTISVADAGPGIDPGRIATLFNRFDRAGRAGAEGIGLGLALVAVYARRQRGEVRCISRVGIGSLFELTLPVA